MLLCKSFLSALNGKMLEFFFRNGPLRRKYDGLKYALKRVENIVFELSMSPSPGGVLPTSLVICVQYEYVIVIGIYCHVLVALRVVVWCGVCFADGGWKYPSAPAALPPPPDDRLQGEGDGEGEAPASKKFRVEVDPDNNGKPVAESSTILCVDYFDTWTFFDSGDISTVRERMEAVDSQREVVIKRSRDTQKFSKQAIFSLHADKLSEAVAKLDMARDVVRDLVPIVTQVSRHATANPLCQIVTAGVSILFPAASHLTRGLL